MSSPSLQSPDPSPDDEPVKILELQHHLHRHLLTYDHHHHGYEDFGRECASCRVLIHDGDATYSCKRCNFFLHKLCADLPRYILNSLHPMHPLELCLRVIARCSLCDKWILYMGYECSLCDFKLHKDCASETTFDPKDHDHSFRNSKPTLFTCDACGIDEQGTKCLSYICSVCQLQIHTSCREDFPLTVRQRMHRHELKLRYSFEVGFDFSNKLCKICSCNMNNVLCLYQCVDGCTGYIAHAKCATSSNLLIEDYVDHNTAKDDDERKEIDARQEQAVITHFSHPHSLVLNNVEPGYDVAVCDGCVKPISAPFYTCDSEECKFFLHEQCTVLPRTIQSPLHQHQLKPSVFPNMALTAIMIHGYTCQVCRVRCNGFVYQCQMCDHAYDVACASFGDTLNHASHKCTLTLISMSPNEENRCIACDSTFSTAYWCGECNFFLDLKCASLPKSIGHDCPTGIIWSIKPIKLRYDCIEHAGGQYYCDLCGETRGKDLWFYHCEDCHDSIHPQCLLGDDRFMYGKFYYINGHCHTVCVAKKPKATDPLCDTCGKPCHHSPLVFCPTCNIYIHADPICCGMSSWHNPIKNHCCGNTLSDSHANEDGDGDHVNKDDDENDQETSIESDVFLGQVNHFSHPHSLIVGEYDPKTLCEEVCDGCGMPISAPFYTCPGINNNGTCNFFLHKECFELPEQIQHPLHPDHPLVLKSFLDLPLDGGQIGFICYGCDALSNGFAYACLECKFFLEVGCSLLSDTLVHRTHQCTLTLVAKNILHEKGPERKCNACNSVSCLCRYSCDECNFELDLHCASLPKTIMHMCSEHGLERRPRHLNYVEYEDRFGDFCDECGDPLGKNEWYYNCEDCNWSTHPRCTSIRSSLLKNRVVYRAYNHFHSLVTPTDGSGIGMTCFVCTERLVDHNNLYCAKCDCYLHVKCCRELRRV